MGPLEGSRILVIKRQNIVFFKDFLLNKVYGLREVRLFNITKMLAPKALLARQEVSEIKISSKHQEQTIFSTQFLAGSLTDAQKSRCMEDRREEGGGGGFF